MAYRTIGVDTAIQLTLGALANGATITFSTATSVKAVCKSIELDPEADETDVSSLGDGLVKYRFKRSKFRVRIKLQIDNSGERYSEKEGYSIKVEAKALSSLSSYRTFVGAIKKASASYEDDENIETLEIIGGIEGWTYSGVYA